MRRAAAILIAALCMGCASVSSDASAVRVTQNPESTHGCTFVKNVETVNMWGPGDSEKKLREETLRAGGNVLFLGPNHFTVGKMFGEAYRCDTPKP